MLREILSRVSLKVFAYSGARNDRRFKEIDEMTSAVLRFPGDRLGPFTTSFGSADVASYDVISTEGKLRLDPAYEYAMWIPRTACVLSRIRRRVVLNLQNVAERISG
jgi:hypothetical protein